ncbi:MAG: ammonium transporter, partial [Symploca sp. SIO2B6]|nr:ammonium transporter [Symploca sp. SIO2B6]
GWAALVGASLLGPRAERLQKSELITLPGHNLGMATLGCLILWLGWFGFNGGSLMTMDPAGVSHIVVTTNIAAAAGALSAVTLSWIAFVKPSLISLINGSLAGLVAVTASAAYVSATNAALIGLIGGLIVIVAELILVKLKVDDPVGAIPVHLGAGIWGTIAVGLFSVGPGIYSWYGDGEGPGAGLFQGGGWEQLVAQFLGILAVAVFTVAFSAVTWGILDYTLGLRVPLAAEKEGLDQSEHGLDAYPEFFISSSGKQDIEN